MKIEKMFKTAIQQALSMFVVSNRVYWVFRKFKRLETMDTSPETWLIDVDFAIHFVEPFKSRKEAQEKLAQIIDFYNKRRPHMSNKMLTPEQKRMQYEEESLTGAFCPPSTASPECLSLI